MRAWLSSCLGALIGGVALADTGDTGEGGDVAVRLSVSDAVATWTGVTGHNFAGELVRVVGDVDGDGLDDVITGMRGHDRDLATANSGAAALVYSRLGHSGTGSLGTQALLTGRSANEWVGYSVAGIGDINGDGYDDIAAGTPEDLGGSGGRVWLVYGGSRRHFGTRPISSVAAAFWNGIAPGARGGEGIAPAGDVDGDGYDDFMVGSAGADNPGGVDRGAVHLVFGSAAAYTGRQLLRGETTWWGEAAGDELGSRYAHGHGDSNGDGLVDLVMGAPGYGADDEGAVYVQAGDGARPTGLHAVEDADSILVGVSAGGDSRFGHALSADGDVDGDGYDDLAVGAFYYDLPETQAGLGTLFYGSSAGFGVTTADAADAVVHAQTAQARLGRDICIAGDLDDDGLDDLVVGMYRWGEPVRQAGATLVLLAADGLAGSYEVDDTDFVIQGQVAWELAGYSVHSGGDIDGDGRDDLLAGAPGLSSTTGALYLFSSTVFD